MKQTFRNEYYSYNEETKCGWKKRENGFSSMIFECAGNGIQFEIKGDFTYTRDGHTKTSNRPNDLFDIHGMRNQIK